LEELEKRLRAVSTDGFDAVRQLAVFERETLAGAEETSSVPRELAQGRAPA
jgi:hypothetical protein